MVFINNFNYLFIDSEGIAFHPDPKLITHSTTKYFNENLKLRKSGTKARSIHPYIVKTNESKLGPQMQVSIRSQHFSS